jgi:PAS domain S-box-containing protein
MTNGQEFTVQRGMASAHQQACGVEPNLQRLDAFSDQPPELELIYDTAPIGLAFLTPDCRYLKINQRLTEICGISVADHIGRSVRETVPQVADQVEFIVRTILRTGEAITGIEVHGQRIDQSNAERCWLTHWHPLRRRDGSILGINVVAEEITERKRSQEAIAVAEQRYRALVRATSSLVWTTPADGQIVDMPEWRAYTGQSIEQVKGWGWLDALHPDDRERTAAVWQKAVDTRSLYETEYRIRRADGVYVWHQVRGVAITESHGGVREWVGICLDIDLRKRATEQQIEAEKALRGLNESLEQRVEVEARERARIWNVSQDMLAVIDAEGKFLNLNPAWTATLGWSESDLVGTTAEWLLHPDDRKKGGAELIQLADGDRALCFENRLRHEDGSFRWLSWTAVPDGGLIYAVARDVTAFKAAEEELRSSRQELARVGRQLTMGAITASIAHEINQPLAAIVSSGNAGLRWLSSTPPNLSEAAVALKRIVSDGRRASRVIETVRAMFKKHTEEKTLLNINDVVQEVFGLLRVELQKHDIAVQFQLAEETPQVMADRVQLQQIFLNLVMNAIEATSSVIDRPRTLRVSSAPHDPAGAIITLEDSGTGIDPRNIDCIFQPFFTTKSNGMGMGLSICRSIIEAHRGSLSASPARPHGTAFRVTLPAGFGRDQAERSARQV